MQDGNYVAIYRRFRPETFDKVLGQKHIVNVLKGQITSDNIPHAFMFCGTRGTGKTTMARLLAKGINCLADENKPCGVCENCLSIQNGTFVDVIEIDAASNNGVNDIRRINDIVIYPPTVGRKRIFIIDEAHMLTAAAANAFLKTLEEPPDNTVFILATTEPSKLPATIRSRCLLFEFKRVSAAVITDGLKDIVHELGIDSSEDALALIASNADGSVRDALSILEQCISNDINTLDREDVLEAIGSVGDEIIAKLSRDVYEGNTGSALLLLNEALKAGREIRRIMVDWLDYYRSALLIKYLDKPQNILNRSIENIEEIRVSTEDVPESHITQNILKLSKLYNESRWSSHPGILMEMAIIEMSEQGEVS